MINHITRPELLTGESEYATDNATLWPIDITR